MSNWRGNPLVGVLAVALIGVAGFFIYRQLKGPDYKGRAKPLRIHQAKVMADEAKKILPGGGLTVLIVREGEMDEDYVTAFQEAVKGGNLDVKAFKMKGMEPGAEGQAPDPAMMAPEMEGVKAMVDALKANPTVKLVVNFMGLSMTMMGPDIEPPAEIDNYFRKGGKAVILGGGGMMMMDPNQEDPLLNYVRDGLVTLIANKPYVDPEKTKNVDPTTLKPEEYFDTYMMVVRKDNLDAYKKEVKKAMAPPPKKK